MDNSIKKNYGAYEMPDEIYQLFDLERELNSMDLSLDSIGFQPCFHDFFYSITPPDVIPFANTGGNGIHFGFLTDFGEVSTLTEAPIVCVSPTDDPPIKYMAQNIHEFFNLVASVPHAEMLERIGSNPDEEYIQQVKAEFDEYDTVEWKEMRDKISECFRNKFHTIEVDLGSSLKEAKKKRSNSISISTLDGLGVVGSEEITNIDKKKYSFVWNKVIDEQELETITSYLRECNRTEKLAFIRDANYSVVLTPDYEKKFFPFIIELMHSLNLRDEVQRFLLKA